MKNVRELAVDALLSIEKNQSYSNLLLNHYLDQHKVSKKDAGLFTEIVYGTIQRRMTIDYYLAPFVAKQKKLQDWVKILLNISLYQMLYLDRIPERAVIFEAVEIAKKRGHKGVASVVNGVLRSIQRNGVRSLDDITDEIEKISIATSHPKWLVEKWVEQYGLEQTTLMCEQNLKPPFQTARVNTNKATVDEVMEMLIDEGYNVVKGEVSPYAIVSKQGNLAYSKVYEKGLLTIQDESSMLVAPSLGVEIGQTVYDCCAAPGGKTTHIGELLKGTGKVFATDLHDHKVKLIVSQATRLGLTNIEAKAYDSRKVQDIFEHENFDKVLVDAPCSGFGVIRRKPDLKYAKSAKDIEQLATIQKNILTHVAPLVKKGGTLVYSTCTIDKEENMEVVSEFLKEHPHFSLDTEFVNLIPEVAHKYVENGMLQILPHYFNSDGFFIARLKRQV